VIPDLEPMLLKLKWEDLKKLLENISKLLELLKMITVT
jgi:hypothetical protein